MLSFTSRSELLASLRRTLTVPSGRLSSMTQLSPSEYAQYMLVPEWGSGLEQKEHIATVRVTQGAQASVYLTEERNTGLLYVMKVTDVNDVERVRLAVKEYEVLKSLDHPNIVKPRGFWLDQAYNRAVLVLPYLGSQTLETACNLPLNQVKHLATQLFSALHYMHSKHLIHRDIKPANLMLFEGNITLIDFQTVTTTETSQWMMTYAGTRDFTAPEMRTDNTYTAKVDVWSAATVILRLSGPIRSTDRDCEDWFAATLETESERRLSAEEALNHKWLKSVNQS